MGIQLSAGVRQNLNSLQATADMLGKVQNRLSTGLKVSSALDNPNSYFTAESLSNRSSDLSSLQDDMGQAVQTLKAADEGIKAITSLVEAAKGKANQALQSSSSTDRAAYAAEFDALIDQIEGIAQDSGYNGKNLLAGTGNDLDVKFNEDGTNKLTISAIDFTDADGVATGELALDDATNAWVADSDVNAALTDITASLGKLRSQASTFGTNLTVVENRQSFTKNMINTLDEGAGKLVLADTNEEGANLLALNTRQQLASTSLSFASQADQNVLRLL